MQTRTQIRYSGILCHFRGHTERYAHSHQGFIQDFTLEGGHCSGLVSICMRNRHCANRALLGGSGGMPPQKNFEKIAALRLNLVGFGS